MKPRGDVNRRITIAKHQLGRPSDIKVTEQEEPILTKIRLEKPFISFMDA